MPTTLPTPSPSPMPTTPPSPQPTNAPTHYCKVLEVHTPYETNGHSIFEGKYVVRTTMRNDHFWWFNSHNGYAIYYVKDQYIPDAWVFQGEPGMDQLSVLPGEDTLTP